MEPTEIHALKSRVSETKNSLRKGINKLLAFIDKGKKQSVDFLRMNLKEAFHLYDDMLGLISKANGLDSGGPVRETFYHAELKEKVIDYLIQKLERKEQEIQECKRQREQMLCSLRKITNRNLRASPNCERSDKRGSSAAGLSSSQSNSLRNLIAYRSYISAYDPGKIEQSKNGKEAKSEIRVKKKNTYANLQSIRGKNTYGNVLIRRDDSQKSLKKPIPFNKSSDYSNAIPALKSRNAGSCRKPPKVTHNTIEGRRGHDLNSASVDFKGVLDCSLNGSAKSKHNLIHRKLRSSSVIMTGQSRSIEEYSDIKSLTNIQNKLIRSIYKLSRSLNS